MTLPDPRLDPTIPHVTETVETVVVRESNTGWWIAGVLGGLVLLAVLWILFMRGGDPGTDQALLDAQLDAAQAQAQADAAALQGSLAGARAGVEVARADASRAQAEASRAESEARAAEARAATPPAVVVTSPEPAPAAVVTTSTPQN